MDKKLFITLVLSMLVSISTNADNGKRLVLIEEFSNTGCGPCARYSPILDSAVSYRLGDVVSVKYHGGYPDPDDMFYLAQKEDMDKKFRLYGVNAVPATVVNGEVYPSLSESSINKLIDIYMEKEIIFDLNLDASVDNHRLKLKACAVPKADVTNENLRLHVCVIEEYYENAAAFKNGETHVRNITRKMLPDADGYNLGSSLAAGRSYEYETEWDISGFGNEKNLGVVAFLQDMQTHEVLATAYVPRKTDSTDDLCLMNVEGTPDRICIPEYHGTVTFRNRGANEVTRATLNVSVNGYVRQYPWSGSLSYLGRDVIGFDDFTDFVLKADGTRNNAEIWFSDVNGTDRESNRVSLSFSNAVTAVSGIMLRIYTDNKPEETTWEVVNSAGDVVDAGGPYAEARKFYDELLELDSDDCYTIIFHDAGGDGIKGKNGNGYFIVYQYTAEGKKTNVTQGDYTGETHTVNFSLSNVDTTLGIGNATAGALSPDTPVSIYDTAGRLVRKTTAGELKTAGTAAAEDGVSIIRYTGKNGREYKVLTK